MKEVMKDYFEKFIDKWMEYNNSLPQIAWNEDIDEFIYSGEEDEYGYISWKPIEKGVEFSFDEIESQYNVQLHDSVKQYFNSYWFLELTGWVSSYNINLHPVIPGIEPDYFISLVKDYAESKEDIIKFIPIGFESNGMLIVLDNNTGEILVEDFELNEYKRITNSLESLISQLKFKDEQ
ncbi:SecY-interacting protein Syd [Bacillus cereus]|uniref:SecY-interacting protein Syd n=1 Tax=Bacillus cereus TaxID=1396 RepID=UPI001F4188AC|nr:SecY-interacting protein Syd [Bacillus cereus]MCU5325808.1 SecY-interacting protein Syd [Bacillus cereus]BCB38281.1 Syd protein [Bacillus cereus]BCC01123.1 Syd protein [Bacillus cereus]BCC24629.1 Syd protein [Bacillus cereus]BCC36209.1 Syd protein [Bacillus cereus]